MEAITRTSTANTATNEAQDVATHSHYSPPSPPAAFNSPNPSVPVAPHPPTPTLARVRAWLRLNAVQRVFSAAVLVPLVTIFLWQSPAFATATVCALIQSVCCYEFAWLAHRIHCRFLQSLQHDLQPPESPSTSPSQSIHVEPFFPPTMRSDDHEVAILQRSNHSFDQQNTSAAIATRPPPPPPPPPPMSAADDEGDDQPTEYAVTGLARSLPLALPADSPSHRLVREWIVAVGVSTVGAAVSVSVFLHIIVPLMPQVRATEFFDSHVFYALSTSFVGGLCACFTPNWRYAAVVFVEDLAFTVLTVHSTVCPINQFSCALSFEPVQVTLVSIGLLLVLRLATSRSGAEAFLLFGLDALGFVYVVGTLSVLVAFVDDDKRTLYRKLLIVLLYVTWASDTGAYVTGKLLALARYPYYHPLAAHLSKNKDYEGTVGAVLWGIVAMFIASNLLDVAGTAVTKIGFTVVGVIIGRVGDLFESLLKRAAGVKDSGALIPGHGGVLDRIDALMFITLVFARYYAIVLGTE